MSDERVEYTFLWFIENYAYCWHKRGEGLQSPCFTSDQLEGKSWYMKVFPRGEYARGYILVYLRRGMSYEGPKTVHVNFELSVITAEGSTLRSEVSIRTFKKGQGDGWPTFVKIEKIPQDTLTVRCRIWNGEGKVRRFAPIFARTRIAVEKVAYQHVVENFSTLAPNQKKTFEFKSHSEKGFVVSSCLYFDDSGEITVEITSSDSRHNLCKRKISLLDATGNMIACGNSDNMLDAEGKDIRTLPLSLSREVILSRESEYLPEDKLTLLCECTFSAGLEFSRIEKTWHETPSVDVELAGFTSGCRVAPPNKNSGNPSEKASAYPSALEDMKALFENQHFTDVELKTKTKSFRAHKSVLCARSPVFVAMMSNDMREKNTNCILVDDLGDDIVQRMLLFLYSDEIGNLEWTLVTRLYYAGDKYQIGRLKEVCTSFMLEHLTTAKAVDLLVLADDHSDIGLKKTVEEFILENQKEVFGSREWENLMKTNPILAMTTMHQSFKR